MGTLLRARWAWLPTGLESWLSIEVEKDGRISNHHRLKPGASIDHGLLLPGLINAHTHLELSDQAGRVPANAPNTPMHEWVSQSLSIRTESPDPSILQAAADDLRTYGVRGCIDISNGTDTEPYLTRADLEGTILTELIGWTRARWEPRATRVEKGSSSTRFDLGYTAHAPVSCSPELLKTVLGTNGIPRTIHCDEAAEDAAFLAHGTGPWAEFLDRLKRPWRPQWQSAESGVRLLDSLGVLDQSLGLVHLVHADEADLDILARSGATAVLCPRSNLHISGRLPDVPAMLKRNIPLAIGTDSLASSPSLDPLEEASVLAKHYPNISPEVWVRALCEGGARLLNRGYMGTLGVDSRPGILSVELPESPDPLRTLLDGSRWKRYWAA